MEPQKPAVQPLYPDPAAFFGNEVFHFLRSYSHKKFGGRVPALDSGAAGWERTFHAYDVSPEFLKEWLGRLEAGVKIYDLRIRINPAVVGRKWTGLSDSCLVVEAYAENGESGYGVAADGYAAPLPPIDTPLLPGGSPAPIYIRYYDFHNRATAVNAWKSAETLNVSSPGDRMTLLCCLMDRTPGHWAPDDPSLEVRLRNGDRYLAGSDGSLLVPSGKFYTLSHRSYLIIADVLAKYVPHGVVGARGKGNHFARPVVRPSARRELPSAGQEGLVGGGRD